MTASARKFPVVPVAAVCALGVVFFFFPLFRVVPLQPAAGSATAGSRPAAPASFDPVAAAAKIWQSDLPAAAARALELTTLVPALRANPETARAGFAKAAGLGAAYYFVRGTGRVVVRERNYLRLELEGGVPDSALVAVRIGPIFGNTVRDGCGLLDVNAFPGLQEFNALSAELNALIEKNLLPTLREKAAVGAVVQFAGCAEAPESAADTGEPLLTIVPVQAAVR